MESLSIAELEHALTFISPDMPRDDWARIGMAIKSEYGNDDGLRVFDAWSSGGQSYSEKSVVATWRSISATGGVTMGSLIHQALEAGWQPPTSEQQGSPAAKQSAETIAKKKQEAAQREAEEAEAKRIKQEAAAEHAMELWVAAEDVQSPTPYLARKGVSSHGLRVTKNNILLVPLVDENDVLWNLQRILPSRPEDSGEDKFYLKDGRKSGLFYTIGDVANSPQILFAEGYSTAASLHEITRLPVVITFDSGNMIRVAKIWKDKYPDKQYIFCGDDDVNLKSNAGRIKATQAAKDVNGVAVFPAAEGFTGTDFNDLDAQFGREAATAIITQILSPHLATPALESPLPTAETAPLLATGIASAATATVSADVAAAQATEAPELTATAPTPPAKADEQSDVATAQPQEQDAPTDTPAATTPEAQPVADAAANASSGAAAGEDDPAENTITCNDPVVNPAQEQSLLALTMKRLNEQFIVTKDKFYFRDDKQTLAFISDGKTFKTQFDTPDVVQAITALAKANGWKSIHLKGSDQFCRRAWLEASLLGLTVTGFVPDEVDKVLLKERLAVAQSDILNTPQQAPHEVKRADAAMSSEPSLLTPRDASGEPEVFKHMRGALRARGVTDLEQVETTIKSVRDLIKSPRAHVGKLLEFGKAPYKHNKDEKELNFYILLETSTGPKEVWGVDLARAFEEKPLKVGDEVLASYQGQQNVLVKINDKFIEKTKNTWFLDTIDNIHAEAQLGVMQPTFASAASAETNTPATTASQKIIQQALALKNVPSDIANQTVQSLQHNAAKQVGEAGMNLNVRRVETPQPQQNIEPQLMSPRLS